MFTFIPFLFFRGREGGTKGDAGRRRWADDRRTRQEIGVWVVRETSRRGGGGGGGGASRCLAHNPRAEATRPGPVGGCAVLLARLADGGDGGGGGGPVRKSRKQRSTATPIAATPAPPRNHRSAPLLLVWM